jgi:hypothetical protein
MVKLANTSLRRGTTKARKAVSVSAVPVVAAVVSVPAVPEVSALVSVPAVPEVSVPAVPEVSALVSVPAASGKAVVHVYAVDESEIPEVEVIPNSAKQRVQAGQKRPRKAQSSPRRHQPAVSEDDCVEVRPLPQVKAMPASNRAQVIAAAAVGQGPIRQSRRTTGGVLQGRTMSGFLEHLSKKSKRA